MYSASEEQHSITNSMKDPASSTYLKASSVEECSLTSLFLRLMNRRWHPAKSAINQSHSATNHMTGTSTPSTPSANKPELTFLQFPLRWFLIPQINGDSGTRFYLQWCASKERRRFHMKIHPRLWLEFKYPTWPKGGVWITGPTVCGKISKLPLSMPFWQFMTNA